MSIISVATGIPQRIFIGSEQGKLASEQDRANWAIRIDERRILFAEPKVLRVLIKRLQEFKILPQGTYELEWPEAFRMSPLERAQTAAQQARAATNVARAMNDFAKPMEGVDYPIRRPTAAISSGGGGLGKGLIAFAGAVPDKAKPGETSKKPPSSNDNSKSGTPPAPEPIVIPTEDIIIKKKELISVAEARQIIFARGELKIEGTIDGKMD
jgi:hypothetical protein